MRVHYIFVSYNHRSIVSKLIRTGERMIQWVNRSGMREDMSHTGLILDADKQDTFEALSKFLQKSDFQKYQLGAYSYRIYQVLDDIHTVEDIAYGVKILEGMEYGYMQIVGLFFKRMWYGIARKFVGSYNALVAGAVCHEANARICDTPRWEKLKFNQNSTVGEWEKALVASGYVRLVEDRKWTG